MASSNFWQVRVYDPTVGLRGLYYNFFIRFDPVPGRDWGPKTSELAARTWAERLIQSDGSIFIQWFRGLHIFPEAVDETKVVRASPRHVIGAGTSIWIEEAPLGSQLLNPVIFGLLLNRWRCEMAAQPPPAVYPLR